MSDEKKPRLSVVVGAHNARATVAECVAALVRQRSQAVELIVVDNSTDGTARVVREQFPTVTLIRAPEKDYIPELWTVGIEASRGDIVALTTAHCIPAADWVEQTMKAHEQRSHAGIGGAIESDPSAGLVDWAIYFCRYSHFMLPFAEETVPEIAGDNASYKRAVLERYRETWAEGFWEPDVHAAMRRDGHELWRTPSIVAYHKKSFGVADFLRNRFWHGRQFGRARAAGLSRAEQAAHVLRSPLVPAVLLARVAREVVGKQRNAGAFWRSLPLLALFYAAWTAGETSGYLSGEEEET